MITPLRVFMSLLHFTAVFATSTTLNLSEMNDENTQRSMALYIDALPSVPGEKNLLDAEAYGDFFFQQGYYEAARIAYKYIIKHSKKARVSLQLAETLSKLGYYYDRVAAYHGKFLAEDEQVLIHCLNGHQMMKPTQNLDQLQFCDCCGQQNIYLGMIKKRCEECDYDLCEDCVNMKMTASMAAQWAASNLESTFKSNQTRQHTAPSFMPIQQPHQTQHQQIEEQNLEEPNQQTSIPNNIGSANHGRGCSPCAWFYKATGCKNGESCERCHRCEDGEMKKRKNAKKILLRNLNVPRK